MEKINTVHLAISVFIILGYAGTLISEIINADVRIQIVCATTSILFTLFAVPISCFAVGL